VTNLRAFLDTIAFSELGSSLLALSDNGYNVLVGSKPSMPLLFGSYRDHPRVAIRVRKDNPATPFDEEIISTAAGRYQILGRIFDAYQVKLALPDFGPASQDAIATEMIRERLAYDDVMAGRFAVAIDKCKGGWASLPGAGYNQHENTMAALRQSFINAGGVVA
jgi:muramidase (phage lysozyme)